MAAVRSLSVFISHTREFASTYSGRSYVEAAASAVNRLGHSIVETASFDASTDVPGAASVAALERSDVVIALVGFRRGPEIPDGTRRSYVEFEVETAEERNIPTLVYMLSDNAPVPIGVFGDVGNDMDRQARFRRRLMDSMTVDTFTTPDDLEVRVLYALGELRDRPSTGGSQRPRDLVFTVPPLSSRDYIPRPELMAPLLDALQTAEPGTTVRITAALRGAGGFGKTTLALAACHERSVRRKFPDGVLWVTVGEQLDGADLAATINDLSELLSGQRPSLTMPEQAGQHFAQVLGGRRVLLVLDDVWRPAQLSPFSYGGERCVRLVTTRNRALIPSGAQIIMVDPMNADQARQLLAQNLGEVPGQDWLLDYTAGWPVLISLVNALLRRYMASGQDLDAAVGKAQTALAYGGPTALDVASPAARTEAISLTVEASLTALAEGPDGQARLARFFSLAVFREDESIPIDILSMLWSSPGNRMPAEMLVLSAERFCLDLVDFSLAQEYRAAEGRLMLHDVMHKFLVHKLGDALPARHRDLVERARGQYAIPDGEWWRLPIETAYLWNRLPWHLSQTVDGIAELNDLVCDLRWIVRKTYFYGLAVVDADLALAASPLAARLRRTLNQCAHLLEPLETEESVAVLMLARLSGVAGLEAIVESYAPFTPSRLAPAWPLPDQPHPALRRVLPGHLGSVCAVAVIEGRSLVASAGGFDGTVHIWDLQTSELRRSLTGHSERVNSICVSRDETWIACGDGDISGSGTIHVWDLETNEERGVLEGVSERVNVVSAFPDGRLLASGDGDIGGGGSVRIWDLKSGRLVRRLPGHVGMVTGLAVAPDGSWLASAGGFDNAVWVWDLTGKPVPRLLEGHTSQITSLAVSPDGTRLASAGGLDGSVRIWDCADWSQAATVLSSGDAEVWSLAWIPDGDRLVAGRGDGSVDVWHIPSNELRSRFSGGSSCVNAVAVAAGQWVVAGESGGMIRVWDTATTDRPAALDGHDRALASVSVISAGTSPPGVTELVTGDSRGRAGSSVRLWACPSGSMEQEITGHTLNVTGILPDIAEDRLITASSDGSVRIWRLPEGSAEASFSGHDGGVWAIAAVPASAPAPAGTRPGWLATAGGFDGTVLVWDLDERALVQNLPGHEGGVWALCAAANGSWLVTGAGNGDLRCFRRTGPSREMSLTWCIRLPAGVEKIAAGVQRLDLQGTPPDDPWMCVGTDSGSLHIVKVDTGRVTAQWVSHTARVRGLDISSAGEYIASVAEDKVIRIWDTGDFRAVTALRLGGMPNDCRWLPGELRLCVVGDDGIHMLDLIDGNRRRRKKR
jgi:WD40 repeat protein